MGGSADIAKRASLVSFFTFLSRVSGFVRDAVIASVFGASIAADLFYLAFRIPNLCRRLLTEGCLTQSFVPVLTEALGRSRQEAKALVDVTFTFLFFFLLVAVGLSIWGAAPLTLLFAPGYRGDSHSFDMAVSLFKILLPYVFCVGLLALSMGVLNSLKRFAAPAGAAIFLNLALIAGTLFFVSSFRVPIYGLAIFVLVGGLLQLLSQIPALRREGMIPRFQMSLAHPDIRRDFQKIGRGLIPSVYGSAVYQVTVFAVSILASFLPVGAVSVLWYAGRLMEFPLGLFAASMATAIFPSLADCAAKRDCERLSKHLYFGLELALFIAIPATIGLFLLAEPIVALLLHRGEFDAESVVQTAKSLQASIVALPLIAFSRILTGAYYSMGSSRIPSMAATISLLTAILSAFFLGKFYGVTGLALATSIGALVHFVSLSFSMGKLIEGFSFFALRRAIGWALFSGAGMGIGVFAYANRFMGMPFLLSTGSLAFHVLVAILIGVLIYGVFNLRAIRFLMMTDTEFFHQRAKP